MLTNQRKQSILEKLANVTRLSKVVPGTGMTRRSILKAERADPRYLRGASGQFKTESSKERSIAAWLRSKGRPERISSARSS